MKKEELFFLLTRPKSIMYSNFSFSDEGEDIALWKLLQNKKRGFYIDVGANHPVQHSNTLNFYLNGWRGINIDPLPGSKELFDRYRKRDINIESAIGTERGVLLYHMYKTSALNTFSPEIVELRRKQGFKPVGVKEIDILPLSDVLDNVIPRGQTIDFMDVDVEGMDLEVLKSNNWEKYRPDYVLAEAIDSTMEQVASGDVALYMKDQGYKLYMKFYGTVLFRKGE